MILFAPYIDNKLPAFYGNALAVPFRLNRAVAESDIKAIKLKIKYATTNNDKVILLSTNWWKTSAQTYEAQFILNEEKTAEIGMYYKVQMCFVDADGVDGYYSTVGIIKKTAQPTVIIEGRENTVQNSYSYTGFYSNEDATEKVATYCFNLYDESNRLVATSGEQIHDRDKDAGRNSSTDSWTLNKNLEPNINYELEYSVYTVNGLRQASMRYGIVETETIVPNLHADFIAESNFEDGIVSLYLCGDQSKVNISGSFIVLRSSELNNFETWDELTRFYLVAWQPNETKLICKDYTCQQGVKYKYAIQAYNSKGLYSDKVLIKNEFVCLDFEDSFLYDGKRQLKIRFNPKVSSFKNVVLETKVDTLGGKHPFFFRNGNVNYKEFPISGLLSLLSDENNEFSTFGESIGPDSTQLVPENYYKERQFKLEALSWLTNGQPKLFRSPAEGNYIVKLMNVSLSPLDTLGRLLHTFNCTAYEVADCTFENLKKYKLIVEPYVEQRELKINQIDLNAIPDELLNEEGDIVLPKAYLAQISADPNVDFKYLLANDESWKDGSTNLTGTFIFPESVLLETPLLSVRNKANNWGEGARLTYAYYDMKNIDNFSYISKIDINDNIAQIIGKGVDINIIQTLEDVRRKTGAFHYLRAKKRDIKEIYRKNEDFYFDSFMQYDKVEDNDWNAQTIYYDAVDKIYYDGSPLNKIAGTPSFMLYVDEQSLDLGGSGNAGGRYEALTGLGKINRLCAGEGVILDVVYQIKEITYTIEEENESIKYYKQKWLLSKAKSEKDPDDLDAKAEEILNYSAYVVILTRHLNALKEEHAIEFAI